MKRGTNAASSSIQEKCGKLDDLKEDCMKIQKQILRSFKGGSWCDMDAFVMASLDRTYHLVDAILVLTKHRNRVALLSLVRPLLDSLLRLYYVRNAAIDGHRIAAEWFRGTKFVCITSSDGKKLTERFLRDAIKNDFPKIDALYDAASDHSHFSRRHFANMIKSFDRKTGILEFRIGKKADAVSDKDLLKFLGGTFNIGKRILRICDEWAENRSSPYNPSS